jgi:hypothetical protein
MRIVSRPAHRELVQIGRSEDDCAGGPQAPDDLGVALRPESGQRGRASGGRQVAAVDVALDRNRETVERSPAGAARLRSKLARRAQSDEGVEASQAFGKRQALLNIERPETLRRAA